MFRILTLFLASTMLGGCLHLNWPERVTRVPPPPPQFSASGTYILTLDPEEYPQITHVVQYLDKLGIRRNVMVTDQCRELEFRPGDTVKITVTQVGEGANNFEVDCKGEPIS